MQIKKNPAYEEHHISLNQQDLWFIQQLNPSSVHYNHFVAFELKGKVEPALLQKALSYCITRHESLRSTFSLQKNLLIRQRIAGTPLDFYFHDLSPLSEAAGQKATEQIIQSEISKPFLLAEGPAARFRLILLTPQQHIFLIIIHTIIADEYALQLLLKELSYAYNNLLNEVAPAGEELTYGMDDLTCSEQKFLNTDAYHKQLTYWQEKLKGKIPYLKLPTDNIPFDHEDARGKRTPFILSGNLVKRLTTFAERQHVSLRTLLLTALQLLLYRYTGEQDLLVGSVAENREQPELKNIIGFLANTLVLRTHVKEQESLVDFLLKTAETLSEAEKNKNVPFNQLVAAINPQRDLKTTGQQGANPFFRVMFVFHNYPPPYLELKDIQITLLPYHNEKSKFDLTLLLWKDGQGLQGMMEYNAHLFKTESSRRFITNYITLLENLITGIDKSVSNIPLLTEEEYKRIVYQWNNTQADYNHKICLHQLFEAQVARQPAGIAIEYTAHTTGSNNGSREPAAPLHITYDELNKQVNSLAHKLIELGIKPEALVAICLRRTPHLLMAVMSTLKAGGAYVPLETIWPCERIRTIIASLPIDTFITDSATLKKIKEIIKDLPQIKNVLVLDSDLAPGSDTATNPVSLHREQTDCSYQLWTKKTWIHMPEHNPVVNVRSENRAYIIYTSGSTGVPKGVVVHHRSAINLIEWVNKTFQVNNHDKLLFVTSICFDLSVYDIFGSLAAGATIVLANESELKDPISLSQLLIHRAITFWDSAPAALQQLVPYLPPTGQLANNQPLRLVFLSGDWIPLKLPDILKLAFPGVQVISLGGATEATVWSNYFPIPELDPAWVSIPYGKPIQNACYYILNKELIPCPVGIPGELYIGGECLAADYMNDPEKTNEKFIPDPFRKHIDPRARMYATGDLARFFPDGNIEFLGRIDHQIKIRGFRIELGEIEANLIRHPAVQETVVVAKTKSGQEKELVAYCVLKQQTPVDELRHFLELSLPYYMIPSHWVFLETMPLTANGKLDRNALPDPDHNRPSLTVNFIAPSTKLEELIASNWCSLLNLGEIGRNDKFFEIGGTSLTATQFVYTLNQKFDLQIPIISLFEAPTIANYSAYLAKNYPAIFAGLDNSTDGQSDNNENKATVLSDLHKNKSNDHSSSSRHQEIAIIGMACRFPGANDPEQFWNNLIQGVESIVTLTDEELLQNGVDPDLIHNPAYVKACAALDEAECFDADFFQYKAKEAELLDPQHRLMLECAWSALEHAGYIPDEFPGKIGIFGGVARDSYLTNNLVTYQEHLQKTGEYPYILAHDKDYPVTRVAFKLNLRGPAINVQTACSTSGVALHLACRSLKDGECEMALVGGCRILAPIGTGYLYVDGGTQSADGHVRAFDAQANGMVRGSGVGYLVLKPLAKALADKDTIYAVIKSSAVNNDGNAKIGFTAPSVQGQSEVITQALEKAGLTADQITYVEAHGTGTTLGDPIEIAALTKTFRASSIQSNYCALGSVKTNIGHLDAGACLASLIKTALALKHKIIPPSLNYLQPNPQIDFANSPFYVNNKLTQWEAPVPRRAGVSSFGLGGTNVHIILEEPPVPEPVTQGKPRQLLILSAKTETALAKSANQLQNYLSRQAQKNEPENLADLAYTLQTGRKNLPYKLGLVCTDREEALTKLSTGKNLLKGRSETEKVLPIFMFPGQGTQYVQMGRALYDHEPFFRQTINECAEILKPLINLDPIALLYPAVGTENLVEQRFHQTDITQPLLFIIEYALARLWMSWGIIPEAMMGHSLGEYTAACLAGIFTLEEALHILACRARLMQAQPAGLMAAIACPADEINSFLPDRLSLAAINAPSACVIAGAREQIQPFLDKLKLKGKEAILLHTSHAFHSNMMEPARIVFLQELKKYTFKKPQLPIVSCFTGTWLKDAEAIDPDYWANQLVNTVQFSRGIKELLTKPDRVFIEVGPGATLGKLIDRHNSNGHSGTCMFSLPAPVQSQTDALETLLTALGSLWLLGGKIDWQACYQGEKRYRLGLPTYAFERKKYWIKPLKQGATSSAPSQTWEEKPMPQDRTELVTDALALQLTGQQSPQTQALSVQPRRDRIFNRLKKLMHELSGMELKTEDLEINFLELGLDSLFLTQLATQLSGTFEITIRFRQLMEELCTLESLLDYLERELPPHALAEVAPNAIPQNAASVTTSSQPALNISVDGQQQLLQQLFTQLASLLSGNQPAAPQAAALNQQINQPMATAPVQPQPAPCTTQPAEDKTKQKKFGAGLHIVKEKQAVLTTAQEQFLREFTDAYNKKTAQSRTYTIQHRKHFADPRVVMGFSPQLKKFVYPLVVNRSSGSRLWDLDDNEYIDLTNCFGANLLGYSPAFLTEALSNQLKQGIEIGPQHPLAGEAAELMCELTGMERAVFCNTGSEAVMGALRLVRTVTGKDLVVTFTDSYHGNFDEVLVRGTKKLQSLPAAPGIPRSIVSNILVLEYGNPESLDIISSRAKELAAVLVEPVQSRNLSLQPREFLQSLRQLTQERGVPLIFDELVTGFRAHLGGAQALFGIKADLATYGKIIGGGMPIGAITGSASYMDALDGGFWQFGDDSLPEVGVTYFAGTFVRHPLAMAGAKAVLSYLKEQGPALQLELNKTMDGFVQNLNDYFNEQGLPLYFKHFSSACRLYFKEESPFNDLLYPLLRYHGVHIYESRTWFLSTAHRTEDLVAITQTIKNSLELLLEKDFIKSERGQRKQLYALAYAIASQPPVPQARLGSSPAGEPGWYQPDPEHADQYLLLNSKGKNAPVSYHPFKNGTLVLVAPTTDSQKEIWFTSQMSQGGNCSFNESISVCLLGDVDISTLKLSILEGIQRHEALRSTFSPDGERFCVHASVLIDIPLFDLSTLDLATREQALTKLLKEEVTIPFSLLTGPLVRVKLIKKTDHDFQVVITSHHIVCDGWSIDVVVKEIGAIYTAKRRGEYLQLKEAYSYSNYSLLLADKEARGENEKALEFWKEKFKDDIPILELPTDKARQAFRSFKAKRIDNILAPDLLQGLRQVASRTGCTFVNVMLAAYKIFLSRLCGQEDIVVGLPVAGQAAVGWNELVGHCVNLLPLRSQPSGNQSFTDYLKQLRAVMLDAYENQQLSFGKLIPELKITRDPSRIPLVAAIFNIDMGIDLKGMKFADHEVNFYANPREYENFEIYLNISPAKQSGFVLEWTINTDLFFPASMEKRIKEFEILLKGIVQNPDELICKLPLLTPEELTTILHTWNKTNQPYPEQKTLHQLCEEQTVKTPHQIALLYEKEALTYQELNSRANQLANYLKAKIPGREGFIALCMDRSPEMIIAMLAILKAGKTYVPIDPAYPQERINFILSDFQAGIILTRQKQKNPVLAELTKALTSMTWLDLDELAPQLAAEERTNPALSAGPKDLAYLLYTSGSTGRPKGVAIEHHSPVALIAWAQSVYSTEELKGVLAATSICFDLSIFEIFVTLATGGCIVLAKDMLELPRLKHRDKLTLINTVPSVMAEVLQSGSIPPNVKTVNLAGEPLASALVNKIYALGTVNKVYDLYGPSEATTYSTFTLRKPGESENIGRPIKNTRAYILDKYLQPVPMGWKGELYLSGAGLARSYLNRPELTNEKFIIQTLAEIGTERLYRTGDLVRYREDGCIEFFGRLDNQVKLRGYRIELNEIATTISEYPGIKNQVIILKEIVPQDKQLVAYLAIASSDHKDFSLTALRTFLQKKLPTFMVPAHYVLLDELPLTPNGKIDLRSLPAPEWEEPQATDEPKTEFEQEMATIWAQILGRKQIGVTTNFFELGGHSLLATRLISLVNQKYGLELPLSVLFLKPTVTELTLYVAAQKYTKVEKENVHDNEEREVVVF